jgi:hypothetical protein
MGKILFIAISPAQIARFPNNLGERTWANVLSLEDVLPNTIFGKKQLFTKESYVLDLEVMNT